MKRRNFEAIVNMYDMTVMKENVSSVSVLHLNDAAKQTVHSTQLHKLSLCCQEFL